MFHVEHRGKRAIRRGGPAGRPRCAEVEGLVAAVFHVEHLANEASAFLRVRGFGRDRRTVPRGTRIVGHVWYTVVRFLGSWRCST